MLFYSKRGVFMVVIYTSSQFKFAVH